MSGNGTASIESNPASAAEPEEEQDPIAALKALTAPVLKAAPRSSFFHIVALLERLTSDAVRVGGEGPPSAEKIRFRHDYDLGFSAGDISSAIVKPLPRDASHSLDKPVPIIELTTTFLGLTGAVSPLPLYLAEEILHESQDNPARRDFLDIFHHRLVSLLYRSVSKYMPAREHVTSRPDTWMRRALFLTGLDPQIQGNGLRIHPSILVRLAPLMAGRGHGPRVVALALREVLSDVLGEDGTVNITQFAGGWTEVDLQQRMALGLSNNSLGVEAIVGKRAYDQSGRFGVEIGPLHGDTYRRFLRDGDLLPVVRDVIELCSKDSLDFDVNLHLAADAVPSFSLSSKGGSELGRDTRLRGATTTAEVMTIPDVGNLVFED